MGRADWIDAALEILVERGIDSVKITRVADAMAVTRGSFYWHFKDRADLLDALIERWESKNTSAMMAAITTGQTLAGAILGLFEAWIDVGRFDPRLEAAIRDWARRSPRVRRVVEAADDHRVRAIAELFKRSGYPANESLVRARIIYFGQIGYYALGIEETMAERVAHTAEYFKCYTGRVLDPEIATAYQTRHLETVNDD
jgi:AcrR family transcriptional regulator